MKKITVEKYETVDGELFDSAPEAVAYERNLITYGVGPTQAEVNRELAKLYAIHQMSRERPMNGDKLRTSKRDYGLCEVEELLDLIYGRRRNDKPVDVKAMIGEIKV